MSLTESITSFLQYVNLLITYIIVSIIEIVWIFHCLSCNNTEGKSIYRQTTIDIDILIKKHAKE